MTFFKDIKKTFDSTAKSTEAPGEQRKQSMSQSTWVYHLISKVHRIHLTLGNQPINNIGINGCHGEDIPGIISRTFLGYNSKIAYTTAKPFSLDSLINHLDHQVFHLKRFLEFLIISPIVL